MNENQEDMRAAYRAWKDARNRFDEEIDAVIDGKLHDIAHAQELAETMKSALARFMEISKPWVGWKSSGGQTQC